METDKAEFEADEVVEEENDDEEKEASTEERRLPTGRDLDRRRCAFVVWPHPRRTLFRFLISKLSRLVSVPTSHVEIRSMVSVPTSQPTFEHTFYCITRTAPIINPRSRTANPGIWWRRTLDAIHSLL